MGLARTVPGLDQMCPTRGPTRAREWLQCAGAAQAAQTMSDVAHRGGYPISGVRMSLARERIKITILRFPPRRSPCRFLLRSSTFFWITT